MPSRLVSCNFKFRISKNDASPPNKDILPKLEKQLREVMEENELHSTKSTPKLEREASFIPDTVVEIICVLHYRMGTKTMQKRVMTEASFSEKMIDILTRLVSQSETLKDRNEERGQLLYMEDGKNLSTWKELPFNKFKHHSLYQLVKDVLPLLKTRILLVFDSCGWMEVPHQKGAEWTVPIDKSYIG